MPAQGSRPADSIPAPARLAELVKHNDPDGILDSVTWPAGYRPACPRCTRPIEGLQEKNAYAGGTSSTVAEPCGCGVDDHAVKLQADALKIKA